MSSVCPVVLIEQICACESSEELQELARAMLNNGEMTHSASVSAEADRFSVVSRQRMLEQLLSMLIAAETVSGYNASHPGVFFSVSFG